MINAIFPTVYRKLRIRAGMTQSELADALGVSRMTVVRFESGRANPNKKQEQRMLELAVCSKVELAELICQQVSGQIERPVRILEEPGGYEPSTALVEAQVFLEQRGGELSAVLARALGNKISTTQLMELAIEKNNKDLAELTRGCREGLADRRQSPV